VTPGSPVSNGGSHRGARLCTKSVRRIGLSARQLAMQNGQPLLHVTDITGVHARSAVANPIAPKRRAAAIGGSFHRHPLALPYGVAPKGDLSCLEQSPGGQYSFVVATGREYLISFYDNYDILGAADITVAAFKMLPTEHMIFTLSMKAPFNQDRRRRGYSVRQSVGAWHIQGQEKMWDSLPASMLPMYSTGALQGTCAATIETTPQLPDATLQFTGVGDSDCLISRSCKAGFTDQLNASTSITKCIKGENIARLGTASQSSTLAGGFPQRAIDGKLAAKPKVDPRVDLATWADNTCILTNNAEPWWQLDLKVPTAVVAVSIVSRKDARGDSLSRAVVSLSTTPDFRQTGIECARLPSVTREDMKYHLPCKRLTTARYVTISTAYTTQLSFCEVYVFPCKLPISGLPAGHSCQPLGPGPELASRPQLMPSGRIGLVDVKLDQFESEHNAGSEAFASRAANTTLNQALRSVASISHPVAWAMTAVWPRSCREVYERNTSAPDGIYTIQPLSVWEPVKVYCDNSRNGGGWTLVVTSATNNWDAQYGSALSVNRQRPSLTSDYSCLGIADAIKDDPSATGTIIEYRLEAQTVGANGGIWTAPREYSFIDRTGSDRTGVNLTTRFGTWSYNDHGIEQRMPWLACDVTGGTTSCPKAMLTTNHDAETTWFGSIIAGSSSYNPAAWQNAAGVPNPGTIWYWMREGPSADPQSRRSVCVARQNQASLLDVAPAGPNAVSCADISPETVVVDGKHDTCVTWSREMRDPVLSIDISPSTMTELVYVWATRGKYNGSRATTLRGYTCQSWDAQTPNVHAYTPDKFPELSGHNYCRNPDNRASGPWCYTTDGVPWQTCGIGGEVSVRLAHDGESWSDAEEHACSVHRTGFTGPHNLQVDQTAYDGGAAFYCNGCPPPYVSDEVYDRGSTPRCNSSAFEAAPFTKILVGVDSFQPLQLCEVAAFATQSIGGFRPMHGGFYYDSWDNNNVSKWDTDPWYFKKENPKDYNPAFTSAMSVILAGNTSVSVGSHICPRAGCVWDPPNIVSADERVFLWSDARGWDRSGDPDVDVPSEYADVEIPEKWTVILDVVTPVMRVLTIRGQLLYQTQPSAPAIGVHAHFIDIRGGKMEIGNHTMPFLGQNAFIILHGDSYVWDGMRFGECNSEKDPLRDVRRPECAKKINVRGDLNIFGKRRDIIRRVAADAMIGQHSIKVDQPVTWGLGDEVLVTAVTDTKHSLRIWAGQFSGGRKSFGGKEKLIVHQVSPDGLTVTFTRPLSMFHSGTKVEQDGVLIDTRDTIALTSRNVQIKAGHDPLFDTVSGVPVAAQGYGFTIREFRPH
jgi:hypothetical protein